MAKRKVVKLELEEDFDFLLLGLVSTAKDYRLCYQINKMFEIDLCKEKDIELKINKSGNIDHFSFYEYINEDQEEYLFIGNKGKATSLIPEFKQIDYLFILKNQILKTPPKELIDKFKQSSLFLGIYPIKVSNLKSKENLLF